MGIANGLLVADVMHKRHYPRENGFCYKVYYLCFGLSALRPVPHPNPLPEGEGIRGTGNDSGNRNESSLSLWERARVREELSNSMLSLNRFNLFSFHEKDHGKRNGSLIEPWIRQTLSDWNIPEADGDIVLLTLPRILGYVFNPVSFWFCLDKAGNLRAVLSEVSNTFGEHHNYIAFHDDKRPITQDDWIQGEKVFHVSPFMDVDGYYQYRFAYSEETIGIWINHYNHNGLMLSTSVTGKRRPLTARSLLVAFLRYPMVTLKVIALIHYQAIKILFKGIKYRPKPLPPTTEITR